MAITTLAQLATALPGQLGAWAKAPGVANGGVWYSLWGGTGLPGTGANPSSGLAGDVPTRTTAGAVFFTNPAGGQVTALGRFTGTAAQTGAVSPAGIALYDRLWHNSGVVVTSTSAQTINSVALTRPDSTGAGVEAWWQNYADLGAGSNSVLTISYTNSAGTASRVGSTTLAAATMAFQYHMMPFALDVGDTGVRSIQTYTIGTSLVSGTHGLVLRRLVTMVPMGPTSTVVDGVGLALPRVYDDACLEFLWLMGSTGSARLAFTVALAQG